MWCSWFNSCFNPHLPHHSSLPQSVSPDKRISASDAELIAGRIYAVAVLTSLNFKTHPFNNLHSSTIKLSTIIHCDAAQINNPWLFKHVPDLWFLIIAHMLIFTENYRKSIHGKIIIFHIICVKCVEMKMFEFIDAGLPLWLSKDGSTIGTIRISLHHYFTTVRTCRHVITGVYIYPEILKYLAIIQLVLHTQLSKNGNA